MTNPNILLEIDAYCEATGLAPSTVCVRAIENSRFYAREKRRAEMLASKAKAIRAYMAANPVPEKESAQQ